jgi:hypothetical protein
MENCSLEDKKALSEQIVPFGSTTQKVVQLHWWQTAAAACVGAAIDLI